MQAGGDRIIFPLDVPFEKTAWQWCFDLQDRVGIMKVGLQLFTELGPRAVSIPKETGFDVFLDLKLHDIPNTVKRAAMAAAKTGANFLSVHASGGVDMMEAAVEGAGDGVDVLGITVLTSLAGADFSKVFNQSPNDTEYVVKKLADIAIAGGARGLVCSPLEVKALRAHVGSEAYLVVPGVRPKGSDVNDQKRVATPFVAIEAGADFLVIGRPIRNAEDPKGATTTIAAEIHSANPKPL